MDTQNFALPEGDEDIFGLDPIDKGNDPSDESFDSCEEETLGIGVSMAMDEDEDQNEDESEEQDE